MEQKKPKQFRSLFWLDRWCHVFFCGYCDNVHPVVFFLKSTGFDFQTVHSWWQQVWYTSRIQSDPETSEIRRIRWETCADDISSWKVFVRCQKATALPFFNSFNQRHTICVSAWMTWVQGRAMSSLSRDILESNPALQPNSRFQGSRVPGFRVLFISILVFKAERIGRQLRDPEIETRQSVGNKCMLFTRNLFSSR